MSEAERGAATAVSHAKSQAALTGGVHGLDLPLHVFALRH